jgi:hypothetical protein
MPFVHGIRDLKMEEQGDEREEEVSLSTKLGVMKAQSN